MLDDVLKRKLDRFQSFVTPAPVACPVNSPPHRYRRLADSLRGQLISNHAGSYCLVRTLYPFVYSHGSRRLSDAADDKPLPRSAFSLLEDEGAIELSSTVFIDTETTGLGGAGAVAFLIGCGSLERDGFEVRQYLIPDYSDESAMLEDMSSEFGANVTVVTYNGAAFDLPIIRDRMIINRVADDIRFGRHIDLLHPTRRLFRRRLKDCRLANIEKELFEFERSDDIPGHLIPSVYFEWLSEERLELMPKVLEHNRLDIVSLFYLLKHIADIYRSKGEVLDQVDDLHSLSRIYGRRKETSLVEDIYARIDEIGRNRPAEDILLFHSMNFKRIGALDRAVPIWEYLSALDSREGYRASVELAKYFEHVQKEPRKALTYATRAEKLCPPGVSQRQQLVNRLRRLRGRINRQSPTTPSQELK